MKLVTFAIPVIRPDLLERCLETLYKYTDLLIFNVIVIDQTVQGMDIDRDAYPNLMVIRTPKSFRFHTGNVGFQKANNLALSLTETPYFCFLNDDVEFIHPGWWDGVMDTFAKVEKATPTRPALLVNVASIKLPDWSVGKPAGEHHYILPYKEQYTDADWHSLTEEEHYVNEDLTIKPGTVIDGINLYCSVAKTDLLKKIGIDDRWWPGSAGDYDLCCLASMWGYRCVGTTASWVYHHWSVSFQAAQDEDDIRSLYMPELYEGDLRAKWGERFDLWGVKCQAIHAELLVCEQIMHTDDGVIATCEKHPDTPYAIPPNLSTPL